MKEIMGNLTNFIRNNMNIIVANERKLYYCCKKQYSNTTSNLGIYQNGYVKKSYVKVFVYISTSKTLKFIRFLICLSYSQRIHNNDSNQINRCKMIFISYIVMNNQN